MRVKWLWLCVALVLALALAMPPASTKAHRLYVDWKVNSIEIKAYFGGGEPCVDAVVKVFNEETGELLLEGVTDQDGRFSFEPVLGVTKYRIRVEAVHMPGHVKEVVIDLKSAGGQSVGEELPLYARILAGLGWLMGLAGASMMYVSWRSRRRGR